jgi:hypothetical protein
MAETPPSVLPQAAPLDFGLVCHLGKRVGLFFTDYHGLCSFKVVVVLVLRLPEAVGRILESDVWPLAKVMGVPCSANKCRIQESDLPYLLVFQAAYAAQSGG